MTVVAIIPARGGSKGILRKNLQEVGGETLVAKTVRTCRAVSQVKTVFVSTDSDEIAAEALRVGASVIHRPAEIAGDTNSSEEAILHALNDMVVLPEIVVFAQCTSPFTLPSDIEAGIKLVESEEVDVAFSVVPNKHFLWQQGASSLEPLGHPADHRPRRQELASQFMETGNFYCFRSSGLLEAGYRFHGRIGPVVISEKCSLEIDGEIDLELARKMYGISGKES